MNQPVTPPESNTLIYGLRILRNVSKTERLVATLIQSLVKQSTDFEHFTQSIEKELKKLLYLNPNLGKVSVRQNTVVNMKDNKVVLSKSIVFDSSQHKAFLTVFDGLI